MRETASATRARDPQSRRLDPGLVLLQTALRRKAPQSKNLEERLLAEGHRRLNAAPSRTPAPPSHNPATATGRAPRGRSSDGRPIRLENNVGNSFS